MADGPNGPLLWRQGPAAENAAPCWFAGIYAEKPLIFTAPIQQFQHSKAEISMERFSMPIC